MLAWVGYAAIAVAVIWLLAKLYVAYGSVGGTVIVVVYDAAMYPPIIAVIGLYLILSAHQIDLAIWTYLLIWAVATAVAVGAIRLMVELGDRSL